MKLTTNKNTSFVLLFIIIITIVVNTTVFNYITLFSPSVHLLDSYVTLVGEKAKWNKTTKNTKHVLFNLRLKRHLRAVVESRTWWRWGGGRSTLTFPQPVLEVGVTPPFSIKIDAITDEQSPANARSYRARPAAHHRVQQLLRSGEISVYLTVFDSRCSPFLSGGQRGWRKEGPQKDPAVWQIVADQSAWLKCTEIGYFIIF